METALNAVWDAAPGPGATLGPEPLLEIGHLLTERGQSRGASLLAAVESGGLIGRDRAEVDGTERKPVGVGGHMSIMSDAASSSAAPSSSRTTANAIPAG